MIQPATKSSRRNFVRSVAAVGGVLVAAPASIAAASGKGQTLRDRLWVWAHEAHSYDNAWGLPKNGRMTPVEGAHYLGVPNAIMIRYEGKPAPPYEQYALPFKSLKQVYWSITGAGGATSEEERGQVLRLAADLPNMTGVFMDDFFQNEDSNGAKARGEAPAALSLEQLRTVRKSLGNAGGRQLDLGVTLYTYQLDARIVPHLELCDVISLWTWRLAELKGLEENFAKLTKMLPRKRFLLGCYMWSFGDAKPMPIELMKQQVELGLAWLKAGRIEGMIFLATNICDLGLETVEWTRDWIARNGDLPLA